MEPRKLLAETLGTACLVFFAVGTATPTFGFGVTGASDSAGVVATALAFGVVLLVLAYALGPVSVNPVRSLGPALFVDGTALEQLWVFVLAPLTGGALAALAALHFYPGEQRAPETTAATAVATSPVTATAGPPADAGPAASPRHPAGEASEAGTSPEVRRQPGAGAGTAPVQ